MQQWNRCGEPLGGVKFGTQGPSTHGYKAVLQDGVVVILDQNGREVGAYVGGTPDRRTCYAHIKGVGFIGGWRYPHQKMPLSYLVTSINRGILYHDLNELPTKLSPDGLSAGCDRG